MQSIEASVSSPLLILNDDCIAEDYWFVVGLGLISFLISTGFGADDRILLKKLTKA